MDLGEVIGDSLKYPFSDWKKILVLGILATMSSLGIAVLFIGTLLGIKNIVVIIALFITGYFLCGFLINGYKFRIIKTSLGGVAELPVFNNWIEMFVDGIKVSIVVVVYLLPTILIMAFAALTILPVLGILGSNPSPSALKIILSILSATLLVLLGILYMIIILPINYMAVAHMAENHSKLGAAFRFHEIMDKIGDIGWGNLIIWYLVIGMIYLVILVIGSVVTGIFSILNPVIGIILSSLFVTPYLYMYLNRSIALLYMSEK